jgi:hypothetical protein
LDAAEDLFKPKVRVIDAERIAAPKVEVPDEDEVSGSGQREGSWKAFLASPKDWKDFWSGNRATSERSRYARTASWKNNKRRKHQHRD